MSVTQEVRALTRLDLEGLRGQWRKRYGAPPSLRSPELLRMALAWRIQAGAMGDLDPASRRALRRPAVIAKARPAPSNGSRLVREWKGVVHEVTVVDDGFLHRGETFPSLSQVARKITGSRWNGPRFFGLRDGGASR